MHRQLVLCSLLLFMAVLTAMAQESSIKGRVTDISGGVIPDAHVIIHWDNSGVGVGVKDNLGVTQDLIVSTGKNGEFLALVPSGFYDVFVAARAFSPAAAKIRVKKGQTSRYAVKLKLACVVPDPKCTNGKRFGDGKGAYVHVVAWAESPEQFQGRVTAIAWEQLACIVREIEHVDLLDNKMRTDDFPEEFFTMRETAHRQKDDVVFGRFHNMARR